MLASRDQTSRCSTLSRSSCSVEVAGAGAAAGGCAAGRLGSGGAALAVRTRPVTTPS